MPLKLKTEKTPPLNRPSKYKPSGGLILGNCPQMQSKQRKTVNFLPSIRPHPHEDANDSKRKHFYAFRPSVLTKTMKTLTVNAYIRKRTPKWINLKTLRKR